jgi:hypothetical protein
MTPIVNLLFLRSPTNISWFVMSVIIDSVNRMTRRGRVANIGVKCLKAFSPFFTHFYSSAHVVSGFVEIRVLDAANDFTPCIVDFSFAHSVASEVFPNVFLITFPALGAPTSSKVVARNKRQCSARASAKPFWVPVFGVLRTSFENGPASEGFSCYVNKGWHEASIAQGEQK